MVTMVSVWIPGLSTRSDASGRCIRRSTTTESKEQSCPTSIAQEAAYLLASRMDLAAQVVGNTSQLLVGTTTLATTTRA